MWYPDNQLRKKLNATKNIKEKSSKNTRHVLTI